MPRKFIARYMPDPNKLKNYKSLRLFGRFIHNQNLWHLNRVAVCKAFAIGLFVAFLPIPFQMLVAATFAILWQGNLPLSICLVWITNPFTMAPLFYFCYKIGKWLLMSPQHHFSFQISIHWLTEQLHFIWKPLILGSVVCGIVAGLIGYFGVSLLWRLHIIRRWKNRKSKATQV